MSNLTYIAAILDRSGSMDALINEGIGGFNQFVKEQKELDGEAELTLALFDNQYELIHDGIDLQKVPELTQEVYYARGLTALLDAVGKTATTLRAKIQSLPEDQRPDKCIVLILTDGYENASKEYTSASIKKLVDDLEENEGWDFVYLGANQDAFATAQNYGFKSGKILNFADSKVGTRSAYSAMSVGTTQLRSSGRVDYGDAQDSQQVPDTDPTMSAD